MIRRIAEGRMREKQTWKRQPSTARSFYLIMQPKGLLEAVTDRGAIGAPARRARAAATLSSWTVGVVRLSAR